MFQFSFHHAFYPIISTSDFGIKISAVHVNASCSGISTSLSSLGSFAITLAAVRVHTYTRASN